MKLDVKVYTKCLINLICVPHCIIISFSKVHVTIWRYLVLQYKLCTYAIYIAWQRIYLFFQETTIYMYNIKTKSKIVLWDQEYNIRGWSLHNRCHRFGDISKHWSQFCHPPIGNQHCNDVLCKFATLLHIQKDHAILWPRPPPMFLKTVMLPLKSNNSFFWIG